MKHFYSELGEKWFTYPNLYKSIVQTFPTNSHFVEVGTWKGMSAAYMAVEIVNSGKNIKFDCVDTWEYLDSQKEIPKNAFENLYDIFLKNIEPVKHVITPVRAISWEAAQKYADNSLDFVFIDAAHDYESVKKDINAWYPKIKKEGILAGHDYTWCIDVKNAVDDFFTAPRNGTLAAQIKTTDEGCWIYGPCTSTEVEESRIKE